MDEEPDVQLIESITPDVLRLLVQKKFFELLDNMFSPADGSSPLVVCNAYEHSTRILKELEFDEEGIEDVKKVMYHNGGHCDCEILYNVAEESRLKAKYWKARCAEIQDSGSIDEERQT